MAFLQLLSAAAPPLIVDLPLFVCKKDSGKGQMAILVRLLALNLYQLGTSYILAATTRTFQYTLPARASTLTDKQRSDCTYLEVVVSHTANANHRIGRNLISSSSSPRNSGPTTHNPSVPQSSPSSTLKHPCSPKDIVSPPPLLECNGALCKHDWGHSKATQRYLTVDLPMALAHFFGGKQRYRSIV